MNFLSRITICIALVGNCYASPVDERLLSLFSSARQIDKNAKKAIGIEIREISLLLQQSSTSYQSKKDMDDSGDFAHLVELQKFGYIIVNVSKGLPDGSHPSEQFVRYVATDKGRILISAFTNDKGTE